MNRTSSRRDAVGGIVGLVASAVALSGLPLAPPWPPADAPTDVVAAYFTDHGHAFLLQNCIVWIGFIGFGRVFVGLARLMASRGEKTIATWSLVGTTLMLAALVFGQVPWATLAYEVPEHAAVVRALWNAGLIAAFNVAGLAIAAALLPLGVGLFKTRALPTGFAMLVVITALIGLGLSACMAKTGPFIPNGPIGLLSILSLTIVIIVASILLLRRDVETALH